MEADELLGSHAGQSAREFVGRATCRGPVGLGASGDGRMNYYES